MHDWNQPSEVRHFNWKTSNIDADYSLKKILGRAAQFRIPLEKVTRARLHIHIYTCT